MTGLEQMEGAGSEARPEERRFAPDFFIVGAPKSATSTLHRHLRLHPDIFMCSPKEPHFFSTDLAGLREVKSFADYEALFEPAPPNAVTGEASAFYLASTSAAREIHAVRPDARIIVMLRNPADAARSLYHQLRDGFREDQPSFERAWNSQKARRSGRKLPPYCPEPSQLQYRRVYSYADQVARYFDTFGHDRVKVVLFERLSQAPNEVLDEVLRFLDLPPFEEEVQVSRANTRRESTVPGLARFLASPPRAIRPMVGPLKRSLNRMGVKPSELLMKRFSRPASEGPAPRMDPAVRREIVDSFAPDVARLEALVGEDLSGWREYPAE